MMSPSPRKWEVVSEALTDSLIRLGNAPDAKKAFEALGSSLWWIVIVEDRLMKHLDPPAQPDASSFECKAGWLSMQVALHPPSRTPQSRYRQIADDDPRGKALRGVRHARNRVAHDPFNVFFLDDTDQYADTYTDRYGVWCWKPLGADLPPYGSDELGRHNQRFYRTLLANRPAIDALQKGKEFLIELGQQHNVP